MESRFVEVRETGVETVSLSFLLPPVLEISPCVQGQINITWWFKDGGITHLTHGGPNIIKRDDVFR